MHGIVHFRHWKHICSIVLDRNGRHRDCLLQAWSRHLPCRSSNHKGGSTIGSECQCYGRKWLVQADLCIPMGGKRVPPWCTHSARFGNTGQPPPLPPTPPTLLPTRFYVIVGARSSVFLPLGAVPRCLTMKCYQWLVYSSAVSCCFSL